MRVGSILLVGSLLLSALGAFAQTDRGTITGTVSDASGAVIPGAAIEAKNTGTGIVYTAGSSETGNYTLPQLPVGAYEVSVTLPGFKKFIRPNVEVGVAQTVRIDAAMQVGAAGESVTVEAAAPLLKTESGEVSHNINTDTLNSLPVLTLGAGGAGIRNPLQSITLMPGTSFQPEGVFGVAASLRVNGMPSNSQAIRIEGQDATNGLWRAVNQMIQPSVDSMQEVAVQTGNFDAEYGQAGGGYFNYTMKSGTNQFHGAGFSYFVNEAFNAGTPFTDRITAGDTARAGQHIRNRERRNEWGFNIGGPILAGKLYDGRNKSFFFFNLDQARRANSVSNGLNNVPIAAYRNGDFSSAIPTTRPPACPTCLPGQLAIGSTPAVDPLGRPVFQNAIYDPRTTRSAPDGSTVRDPFPGNVIPQSLMDPVALKIQAMLPPPTNGLLINNYNIPTYRNFYHTTIPSFKIDHNVDANNKLSFYFSLNRQRSPSANGYTQAFSPAAPVASNSYTYRLNYDRTISPTKLLHIGAGYLYTRQPAIPEQTFDQNTLGWRSSFPASNFFPNVIGIGDAVFGGNNIGLGSGFMGIHKDMKPTANVIYTWVKGNHSIKMGSDLVVEGIQIINTTRANGIVSFGTNQTSVGTWQDARGLSGTTGFGYASFLMGLTSGLTISQVTNSRLGNHALAFYAQDSWKVTRKLTLNYGLRYDYVTLLKEQYGRMQSANFNKPNPLLNNRLGAVDYEGDCKCDFNKNYPWAFGPRLSAAYQIADKTVLRAGAGLAYGTAPNNAYLSYSVPDFYTLNAPGYADKFSQLSEGNPFGPGNIYGNKPIVWPDFSPHYPFETAPGVRAPQSPFIYIDRHAGRPPRILQWSLGLQRELANNLLVEAAYVGNRGVWWSAPVLQSQAYNAMTPEYLKNAWGLDITNATDRALLTAPLQIPAGGGRTIPNPAVVSRFPQFADPNNVYPGFPGTQPLKQAIRPYPQWNGVPPFLGPPLGNTWYDSLQVKVTQRLSHGLTLGAAYTFAKEIVNGSNGDTSYLTVSAPLVNDVFNHDQSKQLSSLSKPHALVVNYSYLTPKIPGGGDSLGMKVVNAIVHDWTFSGVLRYQSGDLIRVPGSSNGLLTQLDRGPENNPAVWGGGNTFWNRVSGQSFLLKDPNCHCIDPTQDLVLNKAAWTDAPAGQFGYSAPYYEGYRWQRQPSEAMAFGRNFHLAKENKVVLNVRAEFQNVFNRLFLSMPSVGGPGNTHPNSLTTSNVNPLVTSQPTALTGGYGYINYINGAGARPRSGQIVARLIF